MPSANHQWLPDIIVALRNFGGVARLRDIYRWIKGHRTGLPANYEAVVRATIYSHSSDSEAYVPGYPDLFYNAQRGVWGLRPAAEGFPGIACSEAAAAEIFASCL